MGSWAMSSDKSYKDPIEHDEDEHEVDGELASSSSAMADEEDNDPLFEIVKSWMEDLDGVAWKVTSSSPPMDIETEKIKWRR